MIHPEGYTQFSYNYRIGPHIPDFYTRIHTEGINCQGLLHLVYQDIFNITLPSSLRSKELFEDESLFLTISFDTQPKPGDAYLFGPEGLTDFKKLHIGILASTQENTRWILHATPIENRVTLWPLKDFSSYEKYRVLYRIKRFHLNIGQTP
jgi:hypothetical protein